jgi:hypothetical protein
MVVKISPFLAGRFPDKWFMIREKLIEAVRLEKQLHKTTKQHTADELTQLEEQLKDLVDAAIGEIYKVLKLPHIEA